RHHRLRPADPVKPLRRQQVVGDEERVESELLGPHRKPSDLFTMPGFLARKQVRRDERSELHREALAAPTFCSSSPATTIAFRISSRSAAEMGSSGGRTVSRSTIPCITRAALHRAR